MLIEQFVKTNTIIQKINDLFDVKFIIKFNIDKNYIINIKCYFK